MLGLRQRNDETGYYADRSSLVGVIEYDLININPYCMITILDQDINSVAVAIKFYMHNN